MQFNSLSFLLFLFTVFIIYWSINKKNKRAKNIVLLISSYVFYSFWDYKFLLLLIFSTLLDFFTGSKIYFSKHKKIWLYTSLVVNLGVLCVFKYYNFFINNFTDLLNKFKIEIDPILINITLPIGISFYTFHGLSYVLDIFNKKIKPEKNIINYSLFVSYFPLLVAGPIERATHLLPQLSKSRTFNYYIASKGMKQVLWGLFKKIVIADNCANYVDLIYNYESAHNGSSLLIATILFSFQIYCDFSGYTDIAIGTSKLFGIQLIKNFSFPYFSRNIPQFWKSWHISLTSWFRDYLYIPLGGSRNGIISTVINTFIIFIISGFWHGANWTFIAWGFINACLFIPHIFLKSKYNLNVSLNNNLSYSIIEKLQIILTFSIICFTWIFFRSNNIDTAFDVIFKIKNDIFIKPPIFPDISILFLILGLVMIEWKSRFDDFGLEKIGENWSKIVRYLFYFIIIFSIFWFAGEEQQFIYFQF